MKVDIKLIGYEQNDNDGYDKYTFYDNHDVSEIIVKDWRDGNITVECETYYDSIIKAVQMVKMGIFKRALQPIKVEEMGFSTRTCRCLKRAGIDNINQLAEKTLDELMKVRLLGNIALGEIAHKLKEYGIENEVSLQVTR